ncbi:unnamed protein product [Closterium sp. NIES-64]|nr:unnamed protein product [Closterium sp. NIES-64]CAI5997537.1 unnamed protein product [Closterium sp. NIES-64]
MEMVEIREARDGIRELLEGNGMLSFDEQGGDVTCIAAGRPDTPVVQGPQHRSQPHHPQKYGPPLLKLLSCAFPCLPLPAESPLSCTQLSLLPSPTLSVSFPPCALFFFPPALPYGLAGVLLLAPPATPHADPATSVSGINDTLAATHSAAASGGDGSRGDRGSRQALRAGQGKGRSGGRGSGCVRRWRGGPGRSAWCSWEGPMTNLARVSACTSA